MRDAGRLVGWGTNPLITENVLIVEVCCAGAVAIDELQLLLSPASPWTSELTGVAKFSALNSIGKRPRWKAASGKLAARSRPKGKKVPIAASFA